MAAAHKIASAGGQDQQLDEAVLRRLAWTASGDLSPMAAIFGGIVGQETVKAVTGKFTPIEQFLYFDAVEALPPEALPSSQVAPQVLAVPHVFCHGLSCQMLPIAQLTEPKFGQACYHSCCRLSHSCLLCLPYLLTCPV